MIPTGAKLLSRIGERGDQTRRVWWVRAFTNP